MLLDIHRVFGFVAIGLNAIAGVYALAAWHWKSLRGRNVWIVTIVAEVAIMVQVLLGVLLMTVEDIEPPRIHTFYGFVVFISVAILYSYKYVWRAQNRMELAYGLGGLFLMGLGIQSVLQVM